MESGYDCEFVDGPPKDLHSECSICLFVLRRPYLVDCCGNHFCKSCLDGVNQLNKICPLCKQEGFTAIPNKGLERVLNKKRVYCTNKKLGCEWLGELRQLDSHLHGSPELSLSGDNSLTQEERADDTKSLKGKPKHQVEYVAGVMGKPDTQASLDMKLFLEGCQFVEIHCPYCPVVVMRGGMTEHASECPNRPIVCKHCKKYTATPTDMAEKHRPVCPKFPVSCPNKCGTKIQRKNIGKHVNSTCPLSKLPCEYSHVGCTVVMPRKRLENHLKDGMANHLLLMKKAYSALKSKDGSEGQQKAELTEKVEGTVKKVRDSDEDLYIHQLEKRNIELEREIQRQQAMISKLDAENRRLKSKLDEYYHQYSEEDVDYARGAAKPKQHSQSRNTSSYSKHYPSLAGAKQSTKHDYACEKSTEEGDGLGWLGLAAGVGLGLAGAVAGVAALTSSRSSSGKEKK